MIKRKNLTNRLIALLLIVLGLIFGVTWNSAKFCIGDGDRFKFCVNAKN